jgi:hypothetical protein
MDPSADPPRSASGTAAAKPAGSKPTSKKPSSTTTRTATPTTTADPETKAAATSAPRPEPTPEPDPGPIARDDHYQTNDAYRTYGYMDFPVFDNDDDRGGPRFDDGSPFRTKAVGNGEHGDLKSTSVACADDSGRWCLRYTVHHEGPFRDTFTYTIVDAGGTTSKATVTIDVP